MMKELGFSVPFNAKVAYARGALNTAPETVRSGKLGKGVVESLDALAEKYKDNSGDIRRKKQETTGIGHAVRLLVQLRDFVSVESLLTTFQDMFPPEKNDGGLPNDVVAALMQAYGRDGNYDRVRELWQQAWPANLKRCSKPNGHGIYPTHQHDVTLLVFQMTLTLSAQGDGDALLAMVEDVTGAGFKLTSKTWDLVIQSLARLGHWERAMDFCEVLLMPNWRGWTTSRKALSPEVRQESMSSRVLAPSPEAILTLQGEWFKTRRLAAWSDEVARKLDDMEQKYPLLHHAFIMSSFSDSHAQTVLEGKGKMSQGITKMLSSLPVAELLRMQELLQGGPQNQGKSEKSSDNSTVQDGEEIEEGEREHPAPLRKAEMRQLRAVLRRTLAEKEA
jgi:pentatricopeptide repeat-containing protein PET309